MPFERSCRKSFCKAVSKYVRAWNPIDSQFSIFHQSTHIMMDDINVFIWFWHSRSFVRIKLVLLLLSIFISLTALSNRSSFSGFWIYIFFDFLACSYIFGFKGIYSNRLLLLATPGDNCSTEKETVLWDQLSIFEITSIATVYIPHHSEVLVLSS